jgi:hypothetical protein
MKNIVLWDIKTQSVPHRRHYFSVTELNQLMLCKIWVPHSGDSEECRLLGCAAACLSSGKSQKTAFFRLVSPRTSAEKGNILTEWWAFFWYSSVLPGNTEEGTLKSVHGPYSPQPVQIASESHLSDRVSVTASVINFQIHINYDCCYC